MTNDQLFYTIIGSAAALWSAWCGSRWWRRRRADRAPFPSTWRAMVERRLPFTRRWPHALRREHQGLMRRFLTRKTFVGCAGLQVTEEMRVIIAAEACLLLLNRPTREFADLRWIYLYPDAFITEHETRDEAGVVSQARRDLSGESWDLGRVILSWQDVKRGFRDFHDGYNVVLHEFAHQLDSESGATNGAPLLYRADEYKTWSRVLQQEYDALCRHAENGEATLLDYYGATNPAEFFAVATEAFFEKPVALAEHHPQLFTELKKYYRLDPAEWF